MDQTHGVEHAIKLDPRLSVDQKEALIRIYRSFVADGGYPQFRRLQYSLLVEKACDLHS
ncbi:MAG TPA: hypothetical protein VFE36_14565 [Candidatus Baltobacteraceae bacterium]|nr:hypothetical protein [Candidatus Baltobacteraceae bacterium]